MAETSRFWNGETVGDAGAAPYSDDELASALSTVIGDFVIPYSHVSPAFPGSELNVGNSATIGKVSVTGGAAFVKGSMYTLNAAMDVGIASNAAGNPRIDRIVLRRDAAAQTVRLFVIQGTPAATPAPASIVSATDMSLAWVWVHNGYNDAVDILANEEIHDERVFREIGPSHPQSARKNILKNAEFFGIISPLATNSISSWKLNGPPAIAFNSTTFRGRHLLLTCAATEGIETTVSLNQVSTDDPVFTLSGYLNCTQGEVHLYVYRVNLTTGASTIERIKKFRPMSGQTAFTIRETFNTAEDAIRVHILGFSGAPDIVRIGECTLSQGYMPTVVYNHEVVWLESPLTDASWTATAKSTGLTTINLVSNFGNLILPYIRGVMLRVRCRDSASLAAATFGTAITVHHSLDSPPSTTTAAGIVSCAGKANDTWEEQVMYIPIDITDANAAIKVYVYASGAGTLDATIEILGLVT